MLEEDARIVEVLLGSNGSFRRLHDKHQVLNQQVRDAMEGDLSLDDSRLGKIKKQKLLAKDQMTEMIENYLVAHV
jgi:uncharacterized protein